MANEPTILADSVAHLPHIAEWDRMMHKRMEDFPLGKLLVYRIDSVDAGALPVLAEQFDVLGYKGYILCQNEQDKRNLIKKAIELHRYKGTVWAVRESLRSIGFDNVVIKEGINGGYDHWAKFGLDVTNSTRQLSSGGYADIVKMVNEYKPVRSHLVDVGLKLMVDDTIDMTEEDASLINALMVDDTIILTGVLYYDGSATFDGSHDFSGGDSDVVIFT